jgi:hypothetical protein
MGAGMGNPAMAFGNDEDNIFPYRGFVTYI